MSNSPGFRSYIEAKLYRMAQDRPVNYIITPPGPDGRYRVVRLRPLRLPS